MKAIHLLFLNIGVHVGVLTENKNRRKENDEYLKRDNLPNKEHRTYNIASTASSSFWK